MRSKSVVIALPEESIAVRKPSTGIEDTLDVCRLEPTTVPMLVAVPMAERRLRSAVGLAVTDPDAAVIIVREACELADGSCTKAVPTGCASFEADVVLLATSGLSDRNPADVSLAGSLCDWIVVSAGQFGVTVHVSLLITCSHRMEVTTSRVVLVVVVASHSRQESPF